jgi:hypothetical protein
VENYSLNSSLRRIFMPQEKESVDNHKKIKPLRGASRRWMMTLWPEFLPEFFLGESSSDPSVKEGLGFDRKRFSGLLDAKGLRYYAFCLEKGDSKEHVHLHVYAELWKPQRISFWQRTFGKSHHYEPAKGSQEDCLDYIKREGIHKDKPGKLFFWDEGGAPAISGVHVGGSYDAAVQMLLDGYTIPEIARELGGAILSQINNLRRLEESLAAQTPMRVGRPRPHLKIVK